MPLNDERFTIKEMLTSSICVCKGLDAVFRTSSILLTPQCMMDAATYGGTEDMASVPLSGEFDLISLKKQVLNLKGSLLGGQVFWVFRGLVSTRWCIM